MEEKTRGRDTEKFGTGHFSGKEESKNEGIFQFNYHTFNNNLMNFIQEFEVQPYLEQSEEDIGQVSDHAQPMNRNELIKKGFLYQMTRLLLLFT